MVCVDHDVYEYASIFYLFSSKCLLALGIREARCFMFLDQLREAIHCPHSQRNCVETERLKELQSFVRPSHCEDSQMGRKGGLMVLKGC